MIRRILAALGAALLLATVACAPTPALAQTITPNSKCGETATGYKADGSRTVVTDAVPWARVGATGVWEPCPIEVPKPVPKNCTLDAARTWGDCSDPSARGATVLHGNTVGWAQRSGPVRGELVERCTDGALTTVRSACAQATRCDGSMTVWHDGRWFTIDATRSAIAIDDYAFAKAADDSKLRLRCVAGSFQVVPQCGPQTVVVDGVEFRFSGPPVEVNARLAIPAADGRKRPNKQPLTTAVTCDFSGKLY